jgi:hypothetical protein
MKDKPILAVKGLIGWQIHGRCKYGTFSSGPYEELPRGIKHAVDMSKVYEASDNAMSLIWHRPNLDLALPDNNVRSLFEGCIGHEGTTDGHMWDGKLESLKSCDSVGGIVYLAILKQQGGITVK